MSKSCIKLKADSQKNQTASINENLQQNMNNYRTTRATWYCLQYTVQYIGRCRETAQHSISLRYTSLQKSQRNSNY